MMIIHITHAPDGTLHIRARAEGDGVVGKQTVEALNVPVRQRINQPGCKVIAVDNSEAMIERGLELLASDSSSRVPVEMVCADIQGIAIEDASVVVLNFTLQFIPLDDRLALITRIHKGLKPGGVLILSEKMAFDDQIKQDFHTEAHHDFKRANGYSNLEISQKRTALERVMIPESLNCHKRRLQEAGFPMSEVWFQCFNFASMAAIK